MKKRYIFWGLILFTIVSFYANRNIYYIPKWDMYIKIENNKEWMTDTTIVYFSNSRWKFGDNYIKYHPHNAEISNLDIVYAGDSLYAIERYMEILEIVSKDYKIKPVYWEYVSLSPIESDLYDHYWSDSTWIGNDVQGYIRINHRHGIIDRSKDYDS